MGLGHRLLGGLHGHAGHDRGGLIRHPRLYELGVTVGFAGLRARVYDGLIALPGARPGDRVLDVGCGTGYLARRAARIVTPSGTVVGVDPSAPMLTHARRLAPAACSFQQARAEALPFAEGSFDAVVSSLALHHLPPEARPAAVGELYRVLRPAGRLLIADFRPPRRSHPPAGPPHHRLTELLTAVALALAGRAGARLADTLPVTVSRMTLLRLVRALPDPPTVTPRVLGVDDFAIRRGNRYATILLDMATTAPSTCCPTAPPTPSRAG